MSARQTALVILLILFSLIFSSCQTEAQAGPKPISLSPPLTPTSTPVPTQTSSPTGTATPTLTPTATLTPSKTPPLVFPFNYLVQPGDTLGDIAYKFSVPLSYLVEANQLVDPNLIFAGQTLIITNRLITSTVVSSLGTEKTILVHLSTQTVEAYEGSTLIKTFIVSTGIPGYVTLPGTFKIYQKFTVTRMVGEGYDIPDVPWTMYFYKGYGLHGAYWHNNFGYPMSHGCVNMRVSDAKWLFDWAPLGTTVIVLSK